MNVNKWRGVKKIKTGEIIKGKEDTNRLGIKIIEIKYSVKPDVDPIRMEILHPIKYLDMSGIQVTTKIHFIAALLMHAIADVDFNSARRGICITSDMLQP